MKTLERETRSGRETTRSLRRDPQRRTLLVTGLLIAGFLVFFPTRQLVVQHMQMQRLEERLQGLERENTRLERSLQRLQDHEELELRARERLGLVKPGEQLYLFVPAPTPEPTPTPAEPPWWSRAWSSVVRFVRGSG